MGTILRERSSINMETINQIKIGFLVGANSGASDFRFCSGLNLFNLDVPLKFNKGALLFCKRGVWAEQLVRLRCNTALTEPSPLKYGTVNARGSRHKTRPQSINARAVKICRPSHYIYEPLLGENRALGEILDSTTKENTRLI